MDVREYCDNLAFQLSVWREEVGDVVTLAEALPEADKEIIADQLAQLHVIVEEMARKIEEFRIECRLTVPSKRELRERRAASG